MNSTFESGQSEAGSRSSTGTSHGLIARVRANDAAAWNRLVSLYVPLVARWCRQGGLHEDDLADVFQEVFQAVATHLAEFRNDRPRDTFRGWLRTITLNKVHDHFRKQRREPRGEGGSEALWQMSQFPAPEMSSPAVGRPSADAVDSGSELPDEGTLERQLFRRALEMIRNEFEPRTWQAFWKTAVDNRAAKDVAAELSMSPGAVRVAKSRVLQRLRAELGDLPE
jgi:RNA polymerase sigma-70 factor (ECF subfamily)